MSSSLPYMQFYVADYLADTVHLSTLEHGAYLLLLMNYWQRGEALDSDDKRLSRIAQLSLKDWLKVKEIIAEFFVERDGKWHHKRVERELGIAEAHVEQRRNAGLTSAQRRAQRKGNDRSNETPTTVTTPVGQSLNERAEIPEQNREEQNREEKKSSLRSHKENGASAPSDPGEQKTQRGSRLPEGWEPNLSETDTWIREWGLTADEINVQFDAFRDHWRAKSGKDATKMDWNATWRNWLRRTADDKRNKIQRQKAFEDRFKHH